MGAAFALPMGRMGRTMLGFLAEDACGMAIGLIAGFLVPLPGKGACLAFETRWLVGLARDAPPIDGVPRSCLPGATGRFL